MGRKRVPVHGRPARRLRASCTWGSANGQSVRMSIEVTALSAPTAGHVTETGAPGGSCSDPGLASRDSQRPSKGPDSSLGPAACAGWRRVI